MNRALATALATDDSGVTGVLCADMQGLCVAATGDLSGSAAGYVSAMMRHAQEMSGAAAPAGLGSGLTGYESPTIVIETDSKSIVVKEYDQVTVAVSYSADENGKGRRG